MTISKEVKSIIISLASRSNSICYFQEVSLSECWQSNNISSKWRVGIVKLLTKSSTNEDAKDPAKYRPIALTSCVAKLYTSILKRRLEFFMLSNGYIKPYLQKAFLSGIPGCREHQFRLWKVLQDATSSQRNLCAVWIDLANAYGSVHHNLLNFALSHYHLPTKCKEAVQCIYKDLSVSIKSNDWQTCLTV
jgi:hypothetical protein